MGNGLPFRLAKALRLLAKVFTRMPNQATPALPAMPTRLKSRMMATFTGAKSRSTPKYTAMITPMKTSSSRMKRAWL